MRSAITYRCEPVQPQCSCSVGGLPLVAVVDGKKYALEKVQVKMNSGGKSLSVHLANNGTAKIPPDHTSDLLRELDRGISACFHSR